MFDSICEFDFNTPVVVKVPRESSNYTATIGLSIPLDTLLLLVPKPIKIYWQRRKCQIRFD